MTLSAADRERYARHLVIPGLGEAGQERLAAGSVLVVGAGGLGSPCLYYLAAAGVGRIGIVDSDTVDLSNLQRQILHTTADVGRLKTESAVEKLAALNPGVRFEPHTVRFDAGNALDLVAGYDVVVNAVDNFAARFLANDACVLAGRRLVEAAILRFTGLLMTIDPRRTACYRCVFPEVPDAATVPVPAEVGVFGPVPGVLGAMQAIEAIKLLAGFGAPAYDRLVEFDAADLSFSEVVVRREPECPVCGDRPTITSLEGHQ
jgi:molybdopterin-synthase adenylyltransferase